MFIFFKNVLKALYYKPLSHFLATILSTMPKTINRVAVKFT